MAPNINFQPDPPVIYERGVVTLGGTGATDADKTAMDPLNYQWEVPAGTLTPGGAISSAGGALTAVKWDTGNLGPGVYDLKLHVSSGAMAAALAAGSTEQLVFRFPIVKNTYGPGDPVEIRTPQGSEDEPLNITLQRAKIVDTPDLPLWNIIRRSGTLLSFNRYQAFVDFIFCGEDAPPDLPQQLRSEWNEQRNLIKNAAPGGDLFPTTRLPYTDVEAYRLLKAATEAFMMVNCGVSLKPRQFDHLRPEIEEQEERLGLRRGDTLKRLMRDYIEDTPVNSNGGGFIETLPYLALVRRNVDEVPIQTTAQAKAHAELCYRLLREKFTNPCFLELIWSYWHEEGMLVQSMNAITMRVQNRRGPGRTDPLTHLAIDPLRPLNNLLWGYIQDEQHRLTVARRVYEYDHEYGIGLYGTAVPRVRGADSRSKFLEAFHTLLHRASIFYKDDDDTTTIADPFPVLNSLRDVHLLLAEGAHNQYGDLPWTARHEMLMQQWLLARPEFREFLPTRVMVAYPESWMGRVDAMKRAQGWTETSVRYFHDLGAFGELILLSIRFGNWSDVFDREQAGNWARYWRQEVQWYIHAYQTVTGVDLSADMHDERRAELRPDRYRQPSFHLRRRLAQQQRRIAAQDGDERALYNGRGRLELEQGEPQRHEVNQ